MNHETILAIHVILTTINVSLAVFDWFLKGRFAPSKTRQAIMGLNIGVGIWATMAHI